MVRPPAHNRLAGKAAAVLGDTENRRVFLFHLADQHLSQIANEFGGQAAGFPPPPRQHVELTVAGPVGHRIDRVEQCRSRPLVGC
jgi:hypothetical protein